MFCRVTDDSLQGIEFQKLRVPSPPPPNPKQFNSQGNKSGGGKKQTNIMSIKGFFCLDADCARTNRSYFESSLFSQVSFPPHLSFLRETTPLSDWKADDKRLKQDSHPSVRLKIVV